MSKTKITLGSLGLTDANADRILMWDDSAGAIAQLTASTNLTLYGTSLTGTDIDADADSWARVTPVTDQDSAGVVDFTTSIHLGSNVTESGGRMTVATAGWYLIAFQFSNQSAYSDTMSVYLRKNTTRQLGSIYWEGNTEINYMGMTSVVLCEASANDIFDIYGSGYWTGNTNNEAGTYFTGVRLGT